MEQYIDDEFLPGEEPKERADWSNSIHKEDRGPMHPLEVIKEWRKGCSCSMDSNGNHLHPSRCEECTDAAMKAIEKWYDTHPQVSFGRPVEGGIVKIID